MQFYSLNMSTVVQPSLPSNIRVFPAPQKQMTRLSILPSLQL